MTASLKNAVRHGVRIVDGSRPADADGHEAGICRRRREAHGAVMFDGFTVSIVHGGCRARRGTSIFRKCYRLRTGSRSPRPSLRIRRPRARVCWRRLPSGSRSHLSIRWRRASSPSPSFTPSRRRSSRGSRISCRTITTRGRARPGFHCAPAFAPRSCISSAKWRWSSACGRWCVAAAMAARRLGHDEALPQRHGQLHRTAVRRRHHGAGVDAADHQRSPKAACGRWRRSAARRQRPGGWRC